MSEKVRWHSIGQYQGNHSLTKEALGTALFRGELVLFLGSGVSAPFGLPQWNTLLVDCAHDLGISLDPKLLKSKAGALEAASKIKDVAGSSDAYRSIVSKNLYKHHNRLAPTALFSAVTSMLSGSVRGKISTVITLNFDDLLETFLVLGGYDCQVIKSWPSLTRAADVTIFHPHGFLPKSGGVAEKFYGSSSNIIFSKDEFGGVLSKTKSEWRQIIGSIIRQKVVLAIGLGAGEPHMRALFVDAFKEVSDRPLAFWMSRKKEGSTILSGRDQKFYQACNIVPIVLEDFDPQFPRFIQGICQAAARRYKGKL